MTKRITIKDVAQHAGMSLATVSGVLNGETRFSEKTTKHVWEVANRLNYMPSASARGLRSGASGERVRTGLIMHIVHMSNVAVFHGRHVHGIFSPFPTVTTNRGDFSVRLS